MFSLQQFSKSHIFLRASLEPDGVCDTVVLVTCHKNKCVCTLEKPGYLLKEDYNSQTNPGGGGNPKAKTKENQTLLLWAVSIKAYKIII